MKSKLLNLDDILNIDDRPIHIFPVKEWGGDIRLREITGKQRERLQAVCVAARQTANYSKVTEFSLRVSIVDEEGKPMFTEQSIRQLMTNRNSQVIERILKEVNAINGIGKKNKEDAEGKSPESD